VRACLQICDLLLPLLFNLERSVCTLDNKGMLADRSDMTVSHLARQTVSDTAVFVNHITTRYSNPDVRQRYTPHTMLPLGICLAIGLIVIIVLAM